MNRAFAPAVLAAGFLLPHYAHPHGVVGPRLFVNALTIDDPAVADEAALPTISWQRPPGGGEEYNVNFESDERITERFRVGVNDGYTIRTTPGAKNATGWQNQALIPASGQTGRAIGAIAQLHWHFHDLFPRTLGRPVLSW